MSRLPSTLCTLVVFLAACDSAEPLCPPGQRPVGGRCQEPVQVSVTSVGFLADRVKRATLRSGATDFKVVSLSDGGVVFEGRAGGDVTASDTGEVVRIADFTDVRDPGEYRLELPGGGRSAPFRIGDDVFSEAFRGTMLGLYGQRCGTEVSLNWEGTEFSHAECHLEDGVAAKGWHDAGDYGKYTRNGAFALGHLLLAWDHASEKLADFTLRIPEEGGDVPDILDEARYQLEWLFGMQLEDGSVVDRIAPACFDDFNTMPERTASARLMSTPSTPATANFVSVVARSARAFEPFDAELAERAREAALRGWSYLEQQASPVPPPPADSSCTGGYQNDGELDDRLWAAVELWETTGDEALLATFEGLALANLQVRTDWDWADVGNFAVFTYLDSVREGRDETIVTTLTERLIERADSMATSAETHGYGRSLGDTYYWGINGIIARSTMAFVVAHRLSGDDRYLDAATSQLDHLLGRNYYARSFVTGVGYDPPLNPHHRPSEADGVTQPWPGLLIGGPSKRGQGVLTATTWKDDSTDFESNEVAINWSAALAYALAVFLP